MLIYNFFFLNFFFNLFYFSYINFFNRTYITFTFPFIYSKIYWKNFVFQKISFFEKQIIYNILTFPSLKFFFFSTFFWYDFFINPILSITSFPHFSPNQLNFSKKFIKQWRLKYKSLLQTKKKRQSLSKFFKSSSVNLNFFLHIKVILIFCFFCQSFNQFKYYISQNRIFINYKICKNLFYRFCLFDLLQLSITKKFTFYFSSQHLSLKNFIKKKKLKFLLQNFFFLSSLNQFEINYKLMIIWYISSISNNNFDIQYLSLFNLNNKKLLNWFFFYFEWIEIY